MTITAERPGTCCDCDDPVRPGDLIESTPDGDAHERCPSDTGPLGTACKKCRQHHVGSECR